MVSGPLDLDLYTSSRLHHLLFDPKYSLGLSGLDTPYQTVLSSWASQDDVESESSNEEEDASGQPEGAVDPPNTDT